jgi:glucuronoarabinoxylan endo-1,4-beta-xylanase
MRATKLLLAGLVMSGLVVPMAAQDPATVHIDVRLNERHQTIDGFGTCLISWVPAMERLYATPEFQDAYITQMGASIMRINLWGPSMPTPVEDWRQIRYQDFTLEGPGHRVRMFIDAAKNFQKVNPEMRFIGTVWSPPAWMKENNSITDKSSGAIDGRNYERDGRVFDNRVKKEYFPHFVKWMVEMAKLHKAEGVPLYAISPGNEVMFTQTFESAVLNAEDYAEITGMLGEMLESEGLGDILLFGPETMTSHNWGERGGNNAYIAALEAHPQAWKYFDVWATHGYTDGFTPDTSAESAGEFWKLIAHTRKPFWITEGGTGRHEWPAALHGIGAMIHNALVNGNASAFVPWQATENKPSTHGLMVGTSLTGKSRAAQHYFKYIRPGAVRVTATPASGQVAASAFVHDRHNTLTIVLANPSQDSRQVKLTLGAGSTVRSLDAYRTSASEEFQSVGPIRVADASIVITLPGESMVTLHGQR